MSGIIDCEMHIGDEVFVHGYIDEIRNDTIIIRNVGGYFGTTRDEVFYYEEDGYGTMNKAEPNSSEIPNNCETCRHWWKSEEVCLLDDCQYEPEFEPHHRGEVTEMVEPQIIACPIQDDYAWIYEDEPQTDCKNCNNHDRCVYQPKDEPQRKGASDGNESNDCSRER